MSRFRLFFATDIHGSERCFRKFINAGKYYGAHAIVMGGDITGKAVVPFVDQGDGTYQVELYGSRKIVKGDEEIAKTESEIRVSGYYPYYTDRHGLDELNEDEQKVRDVFSKLMVETLRSWLKLAEERLSGSGIDCFMCPGNDDRDVIDSVLAESRYVVNPEGSVIDLAGNEMISTGWSNPTPWHSPREIPEDQLRQKIASMTGQIRSSETAIFAFHCPPYGSRIDDAPTLDEELRPVLGPGGGPVMASAGSKAVREAIDKYQPLLGLHGHIHESRGVVKIGGTLCINPGSEYGTGILRGAIVELEDHRLKNYQLIAG